ncbi:MAG: hypothetical protein H6624_04535 [Bdellovibrionaceae bacterium]|nr:hypothetical protein [Bdellovibrionales bacterium]MCB9083584.1 hypothetical protein [Pseudobdellovibrionaceae bacterium]
MSNIRLQTIKSALLSLVVLTSGLAMGQAKLDLDDITIKGELHNDDRLKMLARQKNELKNYVKYRTNYRKEIVEGIPKPRPKVSY